MNDGKPPRSRWLAVAGRCTVVVACGAAGFAAAADPISPGMPRVGIFGLEAEGRRVVYVLDRSASMGEGGAVALSAAKREVLRSVAALSDVQQFHLVFYNHRPKVFSPAGGSRRPVFADDANRREAASFVESIRADGGTDHAGAIRAAMQLGPDLVLMVTDGDAASDVAPEDLAPLERALGQVRLVVIQFGPPGAAGSPRLMELARRTGGLVKSVDPLGDAARDDETSR